MFDFAITDELKSSNSFYKINSGSLLFYIKLDSLLERISKEIAEKLLKMK